MSNRVKILAFGVIAEKVQVSQFYFEDVDNTDDLQRMLYETYPQLASMKFAIAVDHEIINQCVELHAGSEIALMPPFSGG